MANILRDQEVADAWIRDRVERKASHQTLQALTIMLEGVVGPEVLKRVALPSSCRVMRAPRRGIPRRGPLAAGVPIHAPCADQPPPGPPDAIARGLMQEPLHKSDLIRPAPLPCKNNIFLGQ